jgi:guanine nucleotide-binding protein subunit alpha
MLLFIAPVSAFNQTLTEDRSVNRLVRLMPLIIVHDFDTGPQWDSFLLWKSLCVHKLLKKATFVLLLNKYDLLDVKLRSGILFRHFVTSYKDRPNKTDDVLQCKSDFTSRRACRRLNPCRRTDLKGKFSAIYQQDPQNKLTLHVHVTCATDSNSTSIVLTRSTCTYNMRAKRLC